MLHRHHLSGAGEYDFVEPDRVVVRFGPPFDGANAGDYRVRVQGDTARLCETSRPHRCMALVRSRSDWVEGPGLWVDTVPPSLAEPPRLGERADLRVTRASLLLRELHVMQTLFREEEGRYTRDLAELERVGWRPVAAADYEIPEVRGTEERLCMVAWPRAAGLPPLYVNPAGQVGYGDACP